VFTYGVYEDANYAGTPEDFAATVASLQARHLDSVLFTNNFTLRDEPLLGVADALGFRIVFGPHAELRAGLWPSSAPATLEHARRVVYPLVDHLQQHPSLFAYNVIDDAPDRLAPKIALAVQAFAERDPQRPAVPVLIGGHDDVARAARPAAGLTYVYPALEIKAPCDFSLPLGPDGPNGTHVPKGLAGLAGRPAADVVGDRLRHVTSQIAEGAPLWVVLQTHGGTRESDPASQDVTALREPTREELRLQHWLALGEGATGVFWFAYSTQQFWTGLRDNEALLAEVTDLARRTLPLRPLLAGLRKGPDRATVTPEAPLAVPFQPYTATLLDAQDRAYLIAANRSCVPQRLTVDVPDVRGWLRDVESDAWYPLGTTLPFRGGDGRLLELIPTP
jgi:hypothetical protein